MPLSHGTYGIFSGIEDYLLLIDWTGSDEYGLD